MKARGTGDSKGECDIAARSDIWIASLRSHDIADILTSALLRAFRYDNAGGR
jgi:hypothetical protein